MTEERPVAERTSHPILFGVVLLLCLVALAASALLLVDYVRPSPVFCGAEGGCGVAKRSAIAYPLGVPLPAFGIAGLLAVAVLALVRGARARLLQAVVAGVGALFALGLLGWQLAHGSICPYCATVDGATVVLGIVSLVAWVKAAEPPPGRVLLGGAVALLVAAVAAPLAVGFTRQPLPEGVPEVILAEIEKTPRGKVTVIDFVDYECPFCRMTHHELTPVLKSHAAQIRLVRKNVPLRMHVHAMDAAKGAVCAESMGQGDAMAEALMDAPVQSLTREGIASLAKGLGLDAAKFDACVNDPATEALVKKDQDAFKAAKGHGLPTIWVGTQKLEGAQEEADLRGAVEGAIRAAR